MRPGAGIRIGLAAIVLGFVSASPAPALPAPGPTPAPDGGSSIYLRQGLHLLYRNLNASPSTRRPLTEVLLYDEAIAARHGTPLDLGRVVQLMLFVDQVYLHRPGMRGLDGALLVQAGGKRLFVAREQLDRLAGTQAAAAPLIAPQLAAMTAALYASLVPAEALRLLESEITDPVELACGLLFVDRADGFLDGRLQAEGLLQLIAIFRRHGIRPVVPFLDKRGPGSWVTAREFIQPLQVRALVPASRLSRSKEPEAGRVRRLMKTLDGLLEPEPDAPTRDHVRGLSDRWSYPEETLRKQRGDCEDLAFVVQSALEDAKIPSRLVFGCLWDHERSHWRGHVWVEWSDQILDLTSRGGRVGPMSSRRRKDSGYRSALWFDSEQVGVADGWPLAGAAGSVPESLLDLPAASPFDPVAPVLAHRFLALAPSRTASKLFSARVGAP